MTVDMRQFFQVFFDETEELLAEMERLLLAVDLDAPETEQLDAIFRAAHSIKGCAATFGFTDLTEVTHVLESLLDLVRRGAMVLTRQHVDAFLAAKDLLKLQLDGHRANTPLEHAAVDEMRALLQALPQGAPGQGAAPAMIQPTTRESAPLAAQSTTRANYLRIALPPLTQGDATALAAELGLLGELTIESGDARSAVFTLRTDQPAQEIIGVCSFLVDPDAVQVTAMPAPADAGGAAGLTEGDGDGDYGFFGMVEWSSADFAASPAPLTPAQIEQAQGYGFFEPLHGRDEPPAGQPERRAERLASSPADRRGGRNAPESSSIRVSVEKVDQLINLVGELVITQAMIEQRIEVLEPAQHERLLNSVAQLVRNTRDLQEAVLSMRMMPMDVVFSRFPRMVRDLADKLGKQVEFATMGAGTELDKGLVERIIDPLTHLVRNSIDHGIEPPAQRLAAGKSEAGRLSLSAAHQGGNVVIEVTDDGAGLDRERILSTARARGLTVSDAMSDAEVWRLIFAPGFTTAETVTDVSGRGVGMDVVQRNISAMGGAVEIRSGRGFGTTISISLPLTMAILDGMSIRVGQEVYILPIGYVVESLQPAAADVKHITGSGHVVRVHDEYLPLIPLHQTFGIAARHTDPSAGIVVVLESDGRKAGLLIDELVGQQQVVVKNLESNYRKVAGVSGATILGDGSVALIIDVAALLRSSRPQAHLLVHA